MRILLVDDDTFLLDMYTTKFSEEGFAVDSAKSAEVALEKLRNGESYDVILFDLVMPGQNGVDFLKVLKSERLGGTPKCIVLSNQGEQSDITEAKRAGADGFIVKAETIPSEVVSKVQVLAK